MTSTILTMDAPAWWTSVSRTGSKIGPVYSEDGFVIADPNGGLLVDPSARFAMPDGPYLVAGTAHIAKADGRTFGASSLLFDLQYAGGYIVISGRTAWGSEVSLLVTADNQPFVYQTITLPPEFAFGLTGLTVRSFGASVAIDTVVLETAAVWYGTNGDNSFTAAAGNAELYGRAGRDTLTGADGNDLLDGGTGADMLAGGRGNDVYFVDNWQDVVTERFGEGHDLIVASVSQSLSANVESLRLTGSSALRGTGNSDANILTGNAGGNVLSGLGGNDTLLGGGGDDVLNGGAGNDLLDGEAGRDILTGATGADVFRFTATNLANLDMGEIADFSRSQHDKIALVGLSAATFIGTAALTAIDEYGQGDFGQFRYVAVSGGVRVEGDANGDGVADWSLFVRGVGSLGLDDFIL